MTIPSRRYVRRHSALVVGALFLCSALGRSHVAAGADPKAHGAIGRSSPHQEGEGRVEWLIVVPHPDDAALVAAGVIARAVRAHVGVAVALMTNGDLGCDRDGAVRESESVRGLAELGLDEQHVYFLGYPDGYLARLGHAVLPPLERRIDGQCVHGNETYALHGHEGRDVHSAWFGTSAAYTVDNAVADLDALLESLRPRQIVVTHPMDIHPDHAATYVLVRRALARTGIHATLHSALVHTGDCWPLGPQPAEPCPRTAIDPSAPFPPLFGALSGYRFTERIPVPDDFLGADIDTNPKLRALRAFRSQLGPSPLESYMFSFARREEPFFVESPEPCEAVDGASECGRHGGPPSNVLLTSAAPQQSVPQELPLSIAFDWPKPQPAVDLLADESDAYRLAFDPIEQAAVLRRVDHGESRVVKTWLLPRDLWGGRDREHVELRFTAHPEEGDVAEIELFVRHELVGVAVDVHPLRTGRSVRVAFDANAGSLELSIRPSARPQPARAGMAGEKGRRTGG